MALPRRQRLKSANIISQVFSTTRPLHDEGISLRVSIGQEPTTVFAVLVPKSASASAVQRNALRRRVTEALRIIVTAGRVAPQRRGVLVVRSAPQGNTALRKVLMSLLKKSGILEL